MQSLQRTSALKKHNWMLLWKKYGRAWQTYTFIKNMNWWSGKIWDWEWKSETEPEIWRVNQEKRWPPIKKVLKFLLDSWVELSMLFQHIVLDSLMSNVLQKQERQHKKFPFAHLMTIYSWKSIASLIINTKPRHAHLLTHMFWHTTGAVLYYQM